MESKEQLLAQVKGLVEQGVISRDEVLSLVREDAVTPARAQGSRLAEVLYYIGGAIVCLGISVLIGQNWEELPNAARVMSTLGTAMAAYIVAILLSQQERYEKIARAFFLISGVLLPVGISVAFHTAGYQLRELGLQTFIVAICLGVFVASFWLFKRTILLIFTVFFGVAFFYALTAYVTGGQPIFDEPEFTEYRTLAVGLTLMLLGYFFSTTPHRSFSGTLYALGSLSFLGAAIALSGFKPEQNVFWELLFPLLVFGVIFLSVTIRSKSFLVFGSLFLMGYILKLTAEYFSDSLGWPFALVIAGFALIGVGYLMVYLNRRYFKQVSA